MIACDKKYRKFEGLKKSVDFGLKMSIRETEKSPGIGSGTAGMINRKIVCEMFKQGVRFTGVVFHVCMFVLSQRERERREKTSTE